MWLVSACLVLSADAASVLPLPADCCVAPLKDSDPPAAHGSSRNAVSTNFLVESRCPGLDARLIANRCEQWRTHLQTKWLAEATKANWDPRCTVVIHGRRESYSAAIGRRDERSNGSSWIDAKDHSITTRRVDLLLDVTGTLSAFGHELTHVVLADAFAGSQPPPWASEGMAVLADPAQKQLLHRRDLDQGLRTQTVFTCAELLQLDSYPAPHRVPAFYGQSNSLVAWLSRRGGTEKFVPFLKCALELGYDQALQKSYGIGGTAELQRLWIADHVSDHSRIPMAAQPLASEGRGR